MALAADSLTRTFNALADPTRRAILARLSQGEATVGELSRPFAISAPAITKHLKVLEGAGLISRSREAQTRPCRIEPAALQELDAWLDVYRRAWEESLDRLGDYLNSLNARGGQPFSPHAPKKESPHTTKRKETSRGRKTQTQ